MPREAMVDRRANSGERFRLFIEKVLVHDTRGATTRMASGHVNDTNRQLGEF
jgi:hypothetical protein